MRGSRFRGSYSSPSESGRHSVSQTDWIELWRSGTSFIRWCKVGSTVHLWWLVSQATSAYWTCPTPLPEGCRPYGNTYVPAVLTDGSGYATGHDALCCVEGSGRVGLQAGATVEGAMNRGCGSYVAAP